MAARIIKALVVLGLAFSGGVFILLGSGVDLDEMMQGRFGASAVLTAGAFLETLLHGLRLAHHELAVGVAMLALAALVAFYRT